MEKEYVLGTNNEELSRLGLQHRIWADATVAVWKRAGIGPGSHVLDLGCGPGFATFDLAQLVSESGRVVAFDESQNFVTYLGEQARLRHLPQIQTKVGKAEKVHLSFKDGDLFDAVYCRWLLCWLPEPEIALASIFNILKPGGRIIIHDYFSWRSMAMAPRSQAVEKLVNAAIESFEENKANLDIGGSLLRMLRSANYDVTYFDSHIRTPRGGGKDSTVHWILSWWRTYGKKLVQMGKLDEEVFAQAKADLSELENNPDCFFLAPPLFEFIAKK